MSAEPYKVTKKQIKCFWAKELDPPNLEEQVLVAESLEASIDSQTLNLYELLKSKFPDIDVENDPDARLQYEYYLQKCSAYYADKLRPKFKAQEEIFRERNVHACQERLREIRFDRLASVPDDPEELVWSDEEAIAAEVDPISTTPQSSPFLQVSDAAAQLADFSTQSSEPSILIAAIDGAEDDDEESELPELPDSENMIDESVIDIDEDDETDSAIVNPLNVSRSRTSSLSEASSLTNNGSVHIDTEEMSAPNATSTQRNTN